MIRKEEGFSLVELLITMVIFVLTIAAATAIFVPLLTQFKQQSKMAETQIEGIVGLETLRRDIEQAGYGLPWNIPTGVAYTEASSSPASTYNDTVPNPPRAILSGNDAVTNTVIGTSDYLVIKSTIVGTNDAAPKWTYIVGKGDGTANVKTWGTTTDDFASTDWIIALIPSRGESEANQRILVNNGSTFSVKFGAGGSTVAANFAPALQYDKYLVYGVSNSTSISKLWMPFNRADYYINNTSSNIPPRCALGTGLLMKSVIAQADGSRSSGMPLMDCVADMEIIYGLDVNNNGNITYTNDISSIGTYSAQTIRDQVKEVHVYILSHEGQKDANYTFTGFTGACATCVMVGEFGLGNDFDLSVITDWQRYRWKVDTMVVHTKNLL